MPHEAGRRENGGNWIGKGSRGYRALKAIVWGLGFV